MVVAVASPSSAPGPGAAGRPHPTYKEARFSLRYSPHPKIILMILRALKELPDPIISSRRAIAKYISDNFSGLPSHHDALLTVHLRRLRSQGLLLMSGHSYLLSTSATAARGRGRGRPPKKASSYAPPQKRGPGRPRKNTALFPVPVLEAKPGRGRPRKNPLPVASSTSSSAAAAAAAAATALSLRVKRGPGRPRKNAAAAASPVAPPPASPLKRGVGRPRKNATPLVKPGPGRPSGFKRGPGRPRKNATPPVLSVPPTAAAVLGVKRGRGRPRKDKPLQSWSVLSGSAAITKRGPGRPRKKRPLEAGGVVAAQVDTADGGEVGAVQNGGENRGPGSPRKEVLLENEPTVSTLVGKRGRGRPKKEKPSAARPAETGDAKSMGIKRGRGRPRKDSSFQAVFAEAAGQVSRDVTAAQPEGDADLLAGKEPETAAVVSVENKETRPSDAGGVVVSEEKTSIDPVEAGSVMPCVNAEVDRMNSDLRTANP
uniref:H15 domain-containing protein n=1 Tax=Oryza glumipatula TaxID=40148 RepID=A0A0E0A3R5_9ORYZ